MCTCYQNMSCSCGCNNGRSGCGRSTCSNNGCLTNTNTVTTNGCGWNTCGWNTWGWNTCGCNRYVSFPVSGTAYVPTSAIHFCPNSLTGNTTNGNTTSNNNNGTTTNNGGTCGCGCGCGFGRCGGARAISNYYEDYYARQYGLNN